MRLRKPGSGGQKRPLATAAERAEKRAQRRAAAPRPAGRRETTTDGAARVAAVAKRSGVELFGIARELVRIPAALCLRVAEWLGEWVLRAWLLVWPYLLGLWRLARRALAYLERTLTPGRATVAVALATAIALAGSQWADLSSISVGVDAYKGVEDVAPAPEVSTKTVGSAHAWVGLALAVLAGAVIVLSARGRPRAARLLVPIGLAVVAISLLIDRPEGLDEGNSALAYESVSANLLAGFWTQLVCGVLLILLAFLLPPALEAGAERSRGRVGAPAERKRERRRLRLSRPRRTAEAGR